MTKNINRLSKAREVLSQSFVDLESAILDKINQAKQAAVASSQMDKGDQEMVSNLNNEINGLQKSLSELGIENENLRSENQKLRSLKFQAAELQNQIKIDLAEIKKIINQN